MKIYVRAARTIEQLETQDGTGLAKSVVKQLVELDPTSDYAQGKGGKYCPWIIRHYKAGDLTKEQFPSLKDSLELFAKDFKKFPKSDINQYKTVDEFLDDSREVGNRPLSAKELEKLHGKQAHAASDEDKKFLCEDGDWELWTPLTYAGSIALARAGGGKQAEWCTAWTRSDNYYRSYTSRGPLYIFLNKNNTGEKYQSHFGSDGQNSWFYDINDREQGQAAFLEFIEKHPNFKEFFRVKDENGIRTMGESVLGYSPDAETIIFPEGTTKLPSFRFPDSCKEVVLPDSLSEITSQAFADSNVERVVANNIRKIGAKAFRNSAISEIDLSHAANICSLAFRDCKNLTDINLNQDEPITIGAFAFDGTSITEVTTSPDMKFFMGAFNNCSNLTLIWEGSAEDSEYAFEGIKLLVVDKNQYPEVYEANKDNVDIELV